MKIKLKTPSLEEVKYRRKWLEDEKTMEYNRGYDLEVNGYCKENGTITLTDEKLKAWASKWLDDPDKYFAFIYIEGVEEPVGEIYYYKNDTTYGTGVTIHSEFRGRGIAVQALYELEKIAFIDNRILELTDDIPVDRIASIKTFEKAGYVHSGLLTEGIKFGEKELTSLLIITKEMYEEKMHKNKF